MERTYRKKPVCIQAIQWTGKNESEVINFCPDCYWDGAGVLIVKTLEGQHVASFGDFIIKGVNGEFYPCKPDIFNKTYDLVIEAKDGN